MPDHIPTRAGLDLDAIRERDRWDFRAFGPSRPTTAFGTVVKDRHALLEHIAELERKNVRLRAAAQEVVDEAKIQGYLKLKVRGEPYRALAAALESSDA